MKLNKIIKKRKHSPAILNSMKSMRDIGMTYRDIGKHFKLSGGTIHKLLHKWCNMYKPEDTVPGKDMVTIEQYAYHHNMSYSGVYHHINNGNIKAMKYNGKLYLNILDELPNKKFLPVETVATILELGETNLSKSQIARLLGINRATVSYYLKDD